MENKNFDFLNQIKDSDFKKKISKIKIIFFTKNINSGSYFLQSLLDSNKEIVVMPNQYNYSDISFLKDLSISPQKWFNLFFPKHVHPIASESGKINYREVNSNLLNIFKEISIRLTNNKKLEESFKSLSDKNQINFMDFLILLNLAYALANKQDLEKIKAILIPCHFLMTNLNKPKSGNLYNEGIFFQKILDDPRAKLLHILRDPRANYASGVYSTNHGGRLGTLALLEIYREFHNSINIFMTFGVNKFYVIKNEDIHLNPKSILNDLTNWIGIEFDFKILSRSTICGIDWIGNSNFGKIDTFDNNLRSNNSWLSVISKYETTVIEFIVGDYLAKYKYEPINKNISIFKFILNFIPFLLFTDLKNPIQNSQKRSKFRIFLKSLKALILAVKKIITEKKLIYKQ